MLVWKGKDSLLVYKLIPREKCDLLRWTQPAAASLKSEGTMQEYRGDCSSWPACSPHKWQSLILAAEFLDLEFWSNDFELILGTEIPYVSSKTFGLLVVSSLNNSLLWDRPVICQIFFLLCDFPQDSESFKLGKTEQTENQLVVIFLFFPCWLYFKKSQLILGWLSFSQSFLLI